MPLSRITSASIANSAVAAADIADGTITAAKIVSIANTQITGNIVSSQITSVANTQLTGTITGSQISSNTLSNTVFQTGSVENYMRANNLDFGLRNRIINGAMQISQRGTSFTGLTDDGGQYTLDRWRWSENGTMDGAQAVTQDSSANTVAGFTNSLKVQTTTAKAALGTSLSCRVEQFIEGLNTYDLAWGTANAKAITISFWVRSSLTGTHGGSIRNSADDRSYPFSYTIVAADTWEQKIITIPGDTTGTWLTTNGTGLRLTFSLGAGTSLSGPANTWAAAGYQNVTGAVSVIGTLNATWYITGVQLEEGSQATPFEYRHHSKELSLCQRYYEVFLLGATGAPQNLFLSGVLTGANCTHTCYFKTTKRTDPSWAAVGGAAWQNTPNNSTTSKDCAIFQNTTSGYFYLGSGVNEGAGFSAEL